MTCQTCDGKGVIPIRCCGPRSPYYADCGCVANGGYDLDPCPECEERAYQALKENAATGLEPDAA